MMQNCKQCLENNWKYELIDGWIRATCNICSNEVEFQTKKKAHKEKPQQDIWHFTKDGEPWMHYKGEEYPVELQRKKNWIKIVKKHERFI